MEMNDSTRRSSSSAHGDDLGDMKWARVAKSLPAPIAWLYRTLFLSLLEPDDPFFLVVRKLMITTSFMWTPFPLGLAIYWSIVAQRDGWTQGLIVSVAGALGMAFLSFVPSWVIVRMTKKATVWVVDFWAVSMIVFFAVIGIGSPIFPAHTGVFACIECSIIAHTPMRHHIWHALVAFVLWMLGAYNVNLAHTDWPLFTSKEAYVPPPGEALFLTFTGFAIVFFMMMALFVQGMEFRTKIEAAEAAVEMAMRVAFQLRRYDTGAVEGTLKKFEEDGRVDEQLIKGFTSINDNLKLYRPHIPNWLVEQAIEELDKEQAELTNNNDESEGTLRMTSYDSQSEGSIGRNTIKSSNVSSLKHSGFHQSGSGGSGTLGGDPDGFYEGPISYAVVDFATELRLKENATNHFVDMVHEYATKTQGALHSFVGDQIFVSWNAARRVPHFEVKACRFLSELFHNSEDFTISGALVTSSARCQFGGSAGKSKALVIDMPWKPVHQEILKYSRKHRTIASDERTYQVADFHFLAQCVDILRIPTLDAAAKPAKVFELIGEKPEGADEWMYNLEETASAPTAMVTAAFEKALDGAYADAMKIIRDIPAQSELSERSTVVALSEKMERCLREGKALGDCGEC